ncbi:MAG: bifunctional diguanylate cyclase/phosphodiesterase [Prochlorothrix sp.]
MTRCNDSPSNGSPVMAPQNRPDPPIPWPNLLHGLQDSLFVLDRQGCYCYVNHAAQTLVQRSAADLLGQPWGAELSTLFGPSFIPLYHQAQTQNRPLHHELATPDRRWFAVQLQPNPEAMLLWVQEITDRKTLEQAAHSGQEQYRSLAEAAPVGIFHTDAAGNCCYVNGRWSQISGFSPQEVLGQDWVKALHPDDRRRIVETWCQSVHEQRAFQEEYRLQNTQGDITWVLGQAVAQYDTNGTIAGYVGTVTDISRYRKLEEFAIRKIRQEQLLNRLFQSIHESLELNVIFETATAEISQLLAPLDCIIVRYHADRGVWKHCAESRHPDPLTQVPPPSSVGLEIPDADNPFAAQLKQLKRVLVPNTAQIEDAINQTLARRFPGGWLLVPIVINQQVWGCLTLMAQVAPFAWHDVDLQLVQSVVDQLEVAIYQANLYAQAQQELEERRRTEAALRASEQRFQNLAANIPGAIFRYVLYADGRDAMLYMSPGCTKVWEVEAKAVETDPTALWEMVHPDDRPAMFASVLESARSLQPWNYEWRIITPSGQLKWLQAAGQPQAGENGSVVWDSMILDVSSIQEAKQEKQESEERYRLLAENTSDLVALHSPDGCYLYISPSVQHILGYTPEDLLGKNPYDLFHPDDRDRVRLESHLKVLQGHSQSITYRIQHQNGHYIWLETLTRPIYDDSGTIYRLQTSSREVTERIQTQQQLQHQALHDALTHLPNRTLLKERLTTALQRQEKQPSYHFAVLFLDLDRFKVINDSLGHIVGDQLLISVAHKLQTLTQPLDVVARWGGDEFVIVLEEMADIAEFLHCTESILEGFHQPFIIDDRAIHITPSIGIVWGDGSYEQAGQLLRDADIAMYRAKNQGKARYELFSPVMHQEAVDQLHLEHDLRHTLESQASELVLYYQPIVSLRTGQITAFETLVRWQHPQRGLLPPGVFIPLAEETRLISNIDFWAIATACQQLRQWRRRFPQAQTLKLSVNLSAQDLQQQNLLPLLDTVLAQGRAEGLDLAGSLTLEITESMLIGDIERTIDLFQAFKAKGIQISLDDFGTGYSSLNYLHRLPLDNLKLDRSFVQTMQEDHKNYKIIETIVTLSRQLDLHAIAEGIESWEQLQQLRQLGYEDGQGYWFAAPLSAAEAEALLLGPPYPVPT